ncbi:MAG: acyloxyacyl hydrolase [Acidobacteria bacterium]|nr:MAG: acyloxyacyl hydrolase [Acidobacteriota bacterium]
MLNRRPLLATAAALLAAAVALPAAGMDGEVAASAGAFDAGGGDAIAEGGVAYRWRPLRRWRRAALEPLAGLSANREGGIWAYGGLRYERRLGRRVVLAPSFAIALFEAGGGKDLGGVLEFRSGLELALELGRGRRVGVEFYHLSNAGIFERNPGSNSLVLTWSTHR